MAIYPDEFPSNPIHSIKPNIHRCWQKRKKHVFSLFDDMNAHYPSITDVFVFFIVFFRCS
ncbi:hypothetical protein RchiOBHm_Chr6g0271291 [Rosa chinensis]|uniref:Uncharacterized protein n=1 Tax=Rosa chinensis TaxID=74649 RepID=A0A2P6PR03_ROSCH|nr:hypothetical protein RchiOBHm_Chr6g0271291 [Rosa chinensis]